MPVLPNPKHELFAQALAKGENASKAYVSAGFGDSRANASRLKANSNVRARVFELQAAGAQSAEVSIASLLGELEEARSKATSLNQLSAAVRATAEKAKISGLLVERQQIEITNADPYENCEAPEDIGLAMADQMLSQMTNARWLPVFDDDRARLAGIFNQAFAEAQAFIHTVERRPLVKEAVALLDVKPTKA